MKNTKSTTGNKYQQHLEEIAEHFTTYDGLDELSNEVQYTIFKKYFLGDSVLEVGSADGKTTELLINDFKHIVALDGSEIALKRLQDRLSEPKITTVHSLFETYKSADMFDTIIMGHIMEHVDDPVSVMAHFKTNLSAKGHLLISVPNALSYHRIAAVTLGMLKTPYELNETDITKGHQRVYDPDTLSKDINKAGYDLVEYVGYWIKPLSNTQLIKQWSKEQIAVYMNMKQKPPTNTAELVAICKKRS